MMPNIWLMRCYYCGITITPPDGYRDEDPCGVERQGVEVCFRAGGVGTGRVEYVLVICPSCHHLLRSIGWFPPEYQTAGDGVWILLLPTTPARPRSRMDGGSAAHVHARSSAVHGRPRPAWDKPLRVPPLLQDPRAERPGPIRRRNGRASARRRHWEELATLALCVATFACAVAGAILYLS